MIFSKSFEDQLDHCYAVMRLHAKGRDFLVVASEENQPCYAYDLDNNYNRLTVWPDVGGTMTMVQIPGTLDFLATQRFYPGFNSNKCRIVKQVWNGTDWDQKVVGDFPYIHRFDLIPGGNGKLLYVGCSIANSKKDTDDWSDPGKVWVGEYDALTDKIVNQRALDIRIHKNHGYKRMDGYSFITGVEGVFKLDWPTKGRDWKLTKLVDRETSDICAADINGDGLDEYLTIEGFHGPYIRIMDSKFKTLSQSGANTPFGHALWGGELFGRNYFIFGWRAGDMDLELITDDHLKSEMIDRHVGPSNVLVFKKADKTYILSANREANQVAVYEVKPSN